MYVGLASLSVLFVASLIGYFVTRYQNESWRGVALPALPRGLWFSTLVLVALSVALHRGERRLAQNDRPGLKTWLSVSLVASLLFLALQFANWREVAEATMSTGAQTLYAFSFYMLTVLHALHVIAGLVPLLVIHTRSANYSSSHSEPVRLTRQYWDFLLVVWFVLFASLQLTS
jgi:heme/copper-type cytochrome/quinol oxidase subunit 3